ncbi:MAG: dehydrogenase [Rhodospirillales bacterium]|nr:dehydrogenase [Rhodospirillales bacterium]
MSKFRVALSADFKKPDGSPAYPMFDLSPLEDDPDVEVAYAKPVDGRMTAESMAGFDALILLAAKFDADSIPADGRLSIVARFGVGYDNVDIEACSAAGIGVVITPDGVRRPVAVTILTFLLALAGKLFDKDKLTREGPAGFAKRPGYMGTGLVGRTLGSIGIGNIGAEMFRMCVPLDMKFIAHDPYADPELAVSLGIELVSLERVFTDSDFLSLNTPLTPETHHMVNAARLATMKPSAYLINTSRGPVVDQPALVAALTSGVIAGAALDVFDPEPPSADDPILKLENVIATPHALCWTDQCFAGIGASDIEQVLKIKSGETPPHLVNRKLATEASFQNRLSGYKKTFG